MTVTVDKNKCIGCGLCTSIAPEVFKMGDDSISQVKDSKADKKFPEKTKEAAENCPVQAIIITK